MEWVIDNQTQNYKRESQTKESKQKTQKTVSTRQAYRPISTHLRTHTHKETATYVTFRFRHRVVSLHSAGPVDTEMAGQKPRKCHQFFVDFCTFSFWIVFMGLS